MFHLHFHCQLLCCSAAFVAWQRSAAVVRACARETTGKVGSLVSDEGVSSGGARAALKEREGGGGGGGEREREER